MGFRTSRRLLAWTTLAVAALSIQPGLVSAQGTQSVSQSIAAGQYPAALIGRPINLRGGMIRIDSRFQHVHVGDDGSNQVAIGLAAGLTDSVEIGISHVRTAGIDYFDSGAFVANFDDGARSYGDVAIYGRYGIINAEDFRLSGEIGVTVPVYDGNPWEFEFGLPVRARLANHFALDLLPEIRIGFGEDATGHNETHFALNVPVSGVLQATNNVWVAGRSGMFWQDFELDTFYFPMLLETGFTVDHAGAAILDVSVQGGFPFFITPGANDALVTDIWTIRLNLQGYLAF